jgi:hypothetical protein
MPHFEGCLSNVLVLKTISALRVVIFEVVCNLALEGNGKVYITGGLGGFKLPA